MPEPPKISGEEAVYVFLRLGFETRRQRGSHVVLRKGERGCVVPLHPSLAPGTLRSAIKQAGLTVPEFIAAWRAS